MRQIKRYLISLLVFVVLYILGWGFIEGYPYIFSKIVEGKIEKVERVDINVALLQESPQTEKINPQLYSFAIAIKTDDGRIWTASAEDRQWASMSEGRCVKAKFFPYPPWKLDKSGTYYGARLLEAWECK
jgi:hypothetical protein